ncbi:MAG: hypothetical protein HOP18_06945 [Deltaproteobacteria bacterium]|nr:hypothetical protein [Deltaproteobacteria bacterium]
MIGILALATVAVIVARMYHVPSESASDLLQREGMPAARQGIALSQQGKALLPPEEQREMDAIYAEAFKTLSSEEHQRFLTLARKGTAATDSEIADSAALVEKALQSLPQERTTRLWALVGKSVRLAQEQTSAGKP